MLRCVLTESDQCSGYGQSDLLFVLFEHLQLVSELLGSLEAHSEQQEDIIDPGHHALCLVSVKPGDSLVSDHVVNCEYQLPGLKVEGDRDLSRERRDEALDVLTVDQLLQGSLLRHHQGLPGPQEAGHDLGQEVRNLLSRVEPPTC